MLRQVTTRARRGSGPRAGGTARAQRGTRRGGQELEAAVGDSRSRIPGQAPDHEPAVLRAGRCGRRKLWTGTGQWWHGACEPSEPAAGWRREVRWWATAGHGWGLAAAGRSAWGLERLRGRSSWHGCPCSSSPPEPGIRRTRIAACGSRPARSWSATRTAVCGGPVPLKTHIAPSSLSLQSPGREAESPSDAHCVPARGVDCADRFARRGMRERTREQRERMKGCRCVYV